MMKPKLNINKIESYSLALAEKLCNEVFSGNKALTGNDIVSLINIEQVNYFVLKNLFEKWSDEQQRLRSPYFNYENEAIKKALQQLANQLSNNILIEKEFFRPLLVKAISDSIQWIITPKAFLENQFQNNQLDTAAKLKNSLKYFKINAPLFKSFSDSFSISDFQKPISYIEYTTSLDKSLSVFENELEDPSLWLERFGSLLSFDFNDIYESIQRNNAQMDELKTQTKPLEVIAKEDSVPLSSKEEKVIDLSNSIPLRTVMPPEKEFQQQEKSILNDQFSKSSFTLNDMLAMHQKNSSVNDRLAKTKIHDLRSAITLNKRFQIINDLFKGNTGEYLFAIEDIENSISHNDALQILQEKFAHKYNWTFEDELLKEFLELIERRFL